MKIFTCLTLSFLAAASAIAGVQSYTPINREGVDLRGFVGHADYLNSDILLNINPKSVPNTRGAARIVANHDVITEASGTAKTYSKECGGTNVSLIYGLYIYEQTFPATIIWDADTAYFANIISNAPYYGTTYVKGVKHENKITVDLPQTLIWHEDNDYGYNLVLLKLNPMANEDGNTYIIDNSIKSFDYEMGEDGSLTMSLPGGFDGVNLPEYVLGVVYIDDPEMEGSINDLWTGLCDIYQTFIPFKEEKVELPEGGEEKTFALINGDYGYPVNVYFFDDAIYFKGMMQSMTSAVVKADITSETDDKINLSIAQNQYLGIYQDETFIYTKKVYLNNDFDPEDPESVYMMLAPDNETYDMVYDKETQTIVPANDNYYLSFNSGTEKVSFVDLIEPFVMQQQDDFDGVPQNPKNLFYDESNIEFFGYSSFDFTIPCLSIEGKLLDTDNLYYSVYVDNSIMEFVEDLEVDLNGYDSYVYWNVTEPTDRLPIWFDNFWDIYKSSNTDVSIGLYMEGMETLGVQTIYVNNGVTTYSDLVTLNIETGEIGYESSVEKMAAGEIISIEFYDLNGRRVLYPDHGIYICRQRLSDGSISVRKIRRP